jgi:hypothetical protein
MTLSIPVSQVKFTVQAKQYCYALYRKIRAVASKSIISDRTLKITNLNFEIRDFECPIEYNV